jgi:hypothetical protein
MSAEPLYSGPAHGATFYVSSAGNVRFDFSAPHASGYIRFRDRALARVEQGARLFLSPGPHVLTLYDPKVMAQVSILLVGRD